MTGALLEFGEKQNLVENEEGSNYEFSEREGKVLPVLTWQKTVRRARSTPREQNSVCSVDVKRSALVVQSQKSLFVEFAKIVNLHANHLQVECAVSSQSRGVCCACRESRRVRRAPPNWFRTRPPVSPTRAPVGPRTLNTAFSLLGEKVYCSTFEYSW